MLELPASSGVVVSQGDYVKGMSALICLASVTSLQVEDTLLLAQKLFVLEVLCLIVSSQVELSLLFSGSLHNTALQD